MTYRITWVRPHGTLVIEAPDDAAVVAVLRAHPRGTTGARLSRLVSGEGYGESEDGMRPAGRLPDTWVGVLIP